MKKNKGITIIGLILTIIIMLILIGVVIQILINGKIFEDAEKIGNKYITSSGDESSNTTVAIGGKQYNSIEDYFGNNKKIKVTIKLYDEINGIDAGTGTAILEETAVLNFENLVLPTGYELYSNIDNSVSNPTVTIENGKATENEYTVKVIKRNNNNIVIENVVGFNKIRLFLNEKYVLKNNIDLSEYSQWTPIGWTDSDDLEFTGELDGNGKTISTLKCDYSSNSASNVGLFAINSGTIKNLKVTANEVYGDSNIGIITGDNAAAGRIENCHVSGPIKSLSGTGGGGAIAGSNTGTIYNCSAKSAVTGYFWTGGIAGKNYGTIEQTYFIGSVNSTLTDNQVVNKQCKYIGGIAGGNTGTISNSYAILTNFVKGYAGVGGIVGWYKNATMVNTYCAGTENVYGAQYVGIDFGYNAGGTSSISGIKTYSTTNTGLTAIPSSYSGDLWDMNGQSYSSCPNLVNNAN